MIPQISEPVSHQNLLASLHNHLEGLRRTADGEVLYKLITRGLKRLEGSAGGLSEAFVSFLHSVLQRYIGDPESHPATRMKARLIQQRLVPYLQPGSAQNRQPLENKRLTTTSEKIIEPRVTKIDPHESSRATPGVKNTTAEIGKLQETLAEQVTETLVAEGRVHELLAETATPTEKNLAPAFTDLKQLFLKGLDELIHERAELQRRLEVATEYARTVKAEREHLQTELDQARQRGLADAVTGLPKREMFVRALEAEVGRVTRYGFSLALALLGVDDFTDFNSRYGREAGDSVLRCYASDILSRFRAYDLVARYSEDQFVILFPNTQQEGAQRALEKARRAVAQSCLTFNGMAVPLPGFSSALTVYLPGEKVPALLARVESVLVRAKREDRTDTLMVLPPR